MAPTTRAQAPEKSKAASKQRPARYITPDISASRVRQIVEAAMAGDVSWADLSARFHKSEKQLMDLVLDAIVQGHTSATPGQRQPKQEQADASLGRAERDQAILRAARHEKLKMNALKARFGMTEERLRQILRDKGFKAGEYREIHAKPRPSPVPWKCAGCGKKEMRLPDLARQKTHDDPMCKVLATPKPKMHRHVDGHWWCYDPLTGRNVRVERYLMQRKLGRRLERHEFARLKDNNPNNLKLSNIRLETVRRWNREAIVDAFLRFNEEHGYYPSSGSRYKEGDHSIPHWNTMMQVTGKDNYSDALGVVMQWADEEKKRRARAGRRRDRQAHSEAAR